MLGHFHFGTVVVVLICMLSNRVINQILSDRELSLLWNHSADKRIHHERMCHVMKVKEKFGKGKWVIFKVVKRMGIAFYPRNLYFFPGQQEKTW